MSGVDVLAVLETQAALVDWLTKEEIAGDPLRRVHAAVVELIKAMEAIHKNLYQLHASGDAGRIVEDEVEIAAAALRQVKGESE